MHQGAVGLQPKQFDDQVTVEKCLTLNTCARPVLDQVPSSDEGVPASVKTIGYAGGSRISRASGISLALRMVVETEHCH